MAGSSRPQVRDRSVRFHGRGLHVRDWGDPDAPTVLLLHGLLGNSREWSQVAARLCPTRRVVVPDQRGHGKSDWADHYAADDLVADVVALADELDLDGFDLVGHSMGGIVSLLYAADHPVHSLTLVDIGPGSLNDPGVSEEFERTLSAMGRASYDTTAEAVEEWLAEDPLAGRTGTELWAEHGLRRRPDGRWEWRMDTAGIGEFLSRRPTEGRLWEAVGRILVPALVLHGELSWALPPESAAELTARLPEGRRAAVPGHGHDLGVQAPAQVADHLLRFLGAEDQR